MATVRELTAKLNFNVDTSQAEKFQRSIRDVNTALSTVKTSAFVKSTQKIISSIKGIKNQLKAGGLKKRIGEWMKGAATAAKEKSADFLSNLGSFIKGIDIKAAAMRTAAAAFAAAAASIILASSKEDAESVVFGKQGQNGLDRLKSQYKELSTLSGGIFDEGALAKGAAGFLEVFNNMDALMDLYPSLVLIAKGSGQSLNTVMGDFAGAIKGKSMDALTKYSGFATWDEKEIEGAKNQGAGFSNMLAPAIVETIKKRLAEKSGSIHALAASRDDDTSYKKRQFMGELKGGATDAGVKMQPFVNELLGGLTELVKWGRGKDSTIPEFSVGGMMGGGGSGVINTYNIIVETQKEAEHADKINRAIESTKNNDKAKSPYKMGLNHGITG